MYGIESTLMQKMQMRLREKIYKEMLEEQSKYKKQKLDPTSKLDYPSRYKTQASPNERNQPKSSSNSYHFQHTAKGLEHFSTFLPVINNNKPRSKYASQETQQTPNYSKEYLKYLKRREKLNNYKPATYKISAQEQELDEISQKQTIPNTHHPAEEQQSDDQKTQLYLQQCEQIINNLKQLTNKSSKKVKPKPNKYQPQDTFYERKAPSRPIRVDQDRKVKLKSFTPKHYSFSESRSPVFNNQNQFIATNQFQRLSNPQQSKFSLPHIAQNDRKTQFNQFMDLAQSKKIKTSQNIRENHRSLSPLRQQTNQKPSKNTETNQETSIVGKSKPKSRNEETQKTQKNGKTSKPSKQKGDDKNKKQKGPQGDLQNAQKKQTAIIKYLKKARACGNILYQKIESHKKNGGQQAEEQQQQVPKAQ